MKPVHPGAILQEDILKEMNISISKAAQSLLVSRKHLSEIIKIIFCGLILFLITGANEHKDFQTEEISFEIDSMDFSEIRWLDSVIISDPQKTIMSTNWGGNPYEIKYINPFSPSTNLFFYLYFPYPDTLFLKVTDVPGKLICEPTKYFVGKGSYRLRGDIQYIKKEGIYIIAAAFCDSTFKRKFIVLK